MSATWWNFKLNKKKKKKKKHNPNDIIDKSDKL